MPRTVVIESPTPEEWDRYICTHPQATSYHQHAWCDVITRSFGHETIRLGVRGGDGNLLGVLPLVHMKSGLFGNFLVSVPFLNYGGVLFDSDEACRLLLEGAERTRRERGASYVELRHRAKRIEGLVEKTHKITMILDLDADENTQWKKLDAKVRNQIRKAQKSGLRVVTGRNELLDGFYGVFCRNMRDLGTPVYGRSFFENIISSFPDTCRIMSVLLDGRAIASGIMTWFGDTLEVPWASSIRDFRDMCPNNLLYWEAIRYAIGNGSAKFDFGRSTPGEGTYRFKKQWGAEPVQLYWQYLLRDGEELPELNPTNPKYRFAINVWQRLPVALTRIVGPRIACNIP